MTLREILAGLFPDLTPEQQQAVAASMGWALTDVADDVSGKNIEELRRSLETHLVAAGIAVPTVTRPTAEEAEEFEQRFGASSTEQELRRKARESVKQFIYENRPDLAPQEDNPAAYANFDAWLDEFFPKFFSGFVASGRRDLDGYLADNLDRIVTEELRAEEARGRAAVGRQRGEASFQREEATRGAEARVAGLRQKFEAKIRQLGLLPVLASPEDRDAYDELFKRFVGQVSNAEAAGAGVDADLLMEAAFDLPFPGTEDLGPAFAATYRTSFQERQTILAEIQKGTMSERLRPPTAPGMEGMEREMFGREPRRPPPPDLRGDFGKFWSELLGSQAPSPENEEFLDFLAGQRGVLESQYAGVVREAGAQTAANVRFQGELAQRELAAALPAGIPPPPSAPGVPAAGTLGPGERSVQGTAAERMGMLTVTPMSFSDFLKRELPKQQAAFGKIRSQREAHRRQARGEFGAPSIRFR